MNVAPFPAVGALKMVQPLSFLVCALVGVGEIGSVPLWREMGDHRPISRPGPKSTVP